MAGQVKGRAGEVTAYGRNIADTAAGRANLVENRDMKALDPLGPIVGVLFEDGSSDFILTTLARAGIPAHFELTERESHSHATRKRAYLKRLGPIFTGFDESTRHRVAENIAKQLMKSEVTRERLNEVLAGVGWALQRAKLVRLREEEGVALTQQVIPNLTDEQKELLRQIVGVYTTGCRSPFLLCPATHTTGPTLLYGGSQPNIEVDGDEIDFQRLANEQLLDLTRNSGGDLRGKPTALAIKVVGAMDSGTEAKAPRLPNSAETKFEPSGSSGPLQVFLCHSSADKPAVRELYKQLLAEGIDPWLDEEKLLAGEDWELEITKAVRASDVVVVCLSRSSITKEGFVQKEIRQALDVADEKPEGKIFLIPFKLTECEVPQRLRRWQFVNLFEQYGYQSLMLSLQKHAKSSA